MFTLWTPNNVPRCSLLAQILWPMPGMLRLRHKMTGLEKADQGMITSCLYRADLWTRKQPRRNWEGREPGQIASEQEALLMLYGPSTVAYISSQSPGPLLFLWFLNSPAQHLERTLIPSSIYLFRKGLLEIIFVQQAVFLLPPGNMGVPAVTRLSHHSSAASMSSTESAGENCSVPSTVWERLCNKAQWSLQAHALLSTTSILNSNRRLSLFFFSFHF